LLDEWQVVPEVLGAVKRAVDHDAHPGRYILTGSIRADLDAQTWPGTGRVVRVPMYGMTVAEQMGQPSPAPLFDRLSREDHLEVPGSPPDLREYVELATRSGFPEAALSISNSDRARWIESYIDQLLRRDVTQLKESRDPAKLRRFFEAYALNSAGVAKDRTLYEAADINLKTAESYEQLLINLMIVEKLPSWRSNRLKRLARSSKRYLIEPALIAGALRIDAGGIMRDGDLLGRTLDTFVAAHLRAELATTESRPRLYHVREEHGRHEIDLIAELAGQRVIAVEVKADAAPNRTSAAHLIWLRDRLGDRFTAGVLLHTGPRSFRIDERIFAAPICSLWTSKEP
ncbi:MAG: DUF4143 domain-containing protein, partial [Actinomycetota bacterium]